MSPPFSTNGRTQAVERASAHSPFLRDAMQARPELVDHFLEAGAQAAAMQALEASGDDVESRLRRQRHGLALTAALGDLAGELSLEQVTRLLSDFADRAIDEAVCEAIRERVPE